jgi:molybdopterin converting factor small subunit
MAKSTSITVLYFAAAQTALGKISEIIQLPGCEGKDSDNNSGFPLSDLAELLVARHGTRGADLGNVLKISKWSVDAEMIDDVGSFYLKGGEEVAVIPPVSGG